MNAEKVAEILGVDLEGETACKSVYYKNFLNYEDNSEYLSESNYYWFILNFEL